MINLKKGEKGKLPKFIASSWQKDLATLWSGCKSNGGNLKTSQKLRGLQFQAINKCQMARSSRAIQDWKDWTYWKVLKISDSTDAVQETSDASTYVISHKECTQAVVKFPVLWLTGSRTTTAFTRGVVSHCSGFFLSAWQMDWRKTAEFAQEKKTEMGHHGRPYGLWIRIIRISSTASSMMGI